MKKTTSLVKSASKAHEIRLFLYQPSADAVREYQITNFTDNQIRNLLKILDSAPNCFHTHVSQLGINAVLNGASPADGDAPHVLALPQ